MTRTRIGCLLVACQGVILLVIVLAPRRSPSLVSLVVGVPLIAAGIVLAAAASRTLGGALTPTPVPVADAGLRTDGPYRWVRHPIYSAILLAALGYLVAMGSWWTATGVTTLLAFFVAKSRWEDRLLHAHYGAQWSSWAARTGALVPRIGQSSSSP